MTHTIVCEVRYRLDPERLDEFEEYGRAWISIIERHGGTHFGYFVPCGSPKDAKLSFPERGGDGPKGEAVALFSFPDEQAYDHYKRSVPLDPEASATIDRYAKPPFVSYRRLFFRPIGGDAVLRGGQQTF